MCGCRSERQLRRLKNTLFPPVSVIGLIRCGKGVGLSLRDTGVLSLSWGFVPQTSALALAFRSDQSCNLDLRLISMLCLFNDVRKCYLKQGG